MILTLCLLSLPLGIAGLVIVFGQERRLGMSWRNDHGGINKTERGCLGILLLFMATLLGLSGYAVVIRQEPFWLVDKVFAGTSWLVPGL